MIFKHYLDDRETEDLERGKKICEYIYERLEPALDCNATLYIFDPYLNIEKEIYEPFKEGEIDNNVWSYLLGYVIEVSKPKEVLVLTGYSITELRKKLRDGSDTLPLQIEHGRGSYCSLLVSKLIRGEGSKSPDELHDRLIIVDSAIRKGFHIGPSLTDLQRKDCTVTFFEDENITDVIDRIRQIWDISLKIRK